MEKIAYVDRDKRVAITSADKATVVTQEVDVRPAVDRRAEGNISGVVPSMHK